MNLLRRIQDATVDPSFQLADILRMCKILAARLDHPIFKEWIGQELNGYDKKESLPNYRILRNLGCRGDFFGPFGSGLKNAPIPPICLPEEFREAISTKYVFLSVSSIESTFVQASQANQSILKMPWMADAVVMLGHNIYENMVCGQAWTDIPASAFAAILDTIKSRILDFVIEIEAEEPNAGDAEIGTKPIPEKVINYMFNKCILNQSDQIALPGAVIQIRNQQEIYMQDNYVNNFQGANVGNLANTVKDSAKQQAVQHIHLSESKKTLAEAAAAIQQLVQQLEQTNPAATEAEKIEYINDETTPSFKRRVVGALQAGGEAAIEEFLDNPYVNVGKAVVKGWMKPE